MSTPPPDQLKTLKLVHEDIAGERDRLRSARAAVTSQLGPLPASAGIVIGLVGGLDHRVESDFLIAAGALFVLVILVSIRYSRLAPYRVLRGRRVLCEKQSGTEYRGDSTLMESGQLKPWYIGDPTRRGL